MEEKIKRAIDNNETKIFYSPDFVMSAPIREYILFNKKRIISDILSLKLQLDDLLVQKVYFDVDFVKASILSGNIDVASNFDNEEMHWFLTINITKIIDFILKKVYFLSDNTPGMLIKNENFVKACLDNGIIQILDYNDSYKKYYYENKHEIDKKCAELICNGVINVDRFSSNLLKNNPEFLLNSVKKNNYDVLFFTEDLDVNKYIIDNYRFFKNDFYKYLRKNNYFINTKLDIKLPSVKNLYISCIRKDVFCDRIKEPLILMTEDNFESFMSYLEADSLSYLFGKRIIKLLDNFGNKIFSLGYEKIKKILNSSNSSFDRFIKIFDPKVNVKMENVYNLYLYINKVDFIKNSILKQDIGQKICENIKKDGIFDEETLKVSDTIKRVIDVSYYDYLCNLINENNINISVINKTSKELINEIFEYYRKLTINDCVKKQEKIEKIICDICESARAHEFDVYMSSRMNFSNGYPFNVLPSDIYLKRVGKDMKIASIKSYILNNKDYFNYFCEKNHLNFKSIAFNDFKRDVKKYLENKKSLYGLDNYLDGVLSRLSRNDVVDIKNVDYYNLPLTDEYLKTSTTLDSLLFVLNNLDIDKLLYFFNDEEFYGKFKEIFFDKQWLFLLDCFKDSKTFYDKKFVVDMINNFDMLMQKDSLDFASILDKYNTLPEVFNYLFDNNIKFNDSNNLISLSRRMLKCLEKEYAPVPYTWEILDDIKVEIGGFDIDDTVLSLADNVMVGEKYDELHRFITTNENGFMIKFYEKELCAIVYGIRYGNTIVLCNLESNVEPLKIIEILKKFINNFVGKMKSFGDDIARIYLSNYDGELDKSYALCVKSIGVKIDYMEKCFCLYNNGKKINKHSVTKYKISDMKYEDVSKRANKLNILRLISMNDYDNLIGYSYIEATHSSRKWYKDSDDIILD